MARLTRPLPLFALLAFITSCVEGRHFRRCHRVFPVHLTAAAMPCQYLCAYNDGYVLRYHVRGEDDGTPCQKHGVTGVCWNGQCVTPYGQADEWSHQADASSKVPLRVRKRDVSSATKGASITKSVESGGDSGTTTKSVQVTKTVKSTAGSEDAQSEGMGGLKGHYITGFGANHGRKGTNMEASNFPNSDVDPFAVKNVPSVGKVAQTYLSGGKTSPHLSKTVRNGGVKVTVQRGPNGERITTRRVTKVIIRRGPTTTLRKIVFRHRPVGGTTGFMRGGNNAFDTKTVKLTFTRGTTGGTGGLTAAGQTGMTRKTSQVTTTLHTTAASGRNPIASLVRRVQQERISGGSSAGGASTATKTVSTVATVTNSGRPSLSVVKVTKKNVTPLTAATLGTSKTATLRGLEVEVPGYTAGLRNQWKWVLARRVGVYPPYVQVLDPQVLYYKLGLQQPNLPSLAGQVHNILNRVPVHPVGSDIYGFLLSSRILEKIRGFTDQVNGLTKLKSILSTSNTPNEDNSNILKSLFTGTESSPSSSNLLQKLLVASLSASGSTPLNLPYAGSLGSSYGGLFGRPYPRSYSNPWGPLLGSQFPGSQWPALNSMESQLQRFGQHPSLDSSDNPRGSTAEYMFSESGKLVPSDENPTSGSPESLLGQSSYIKSLLESLTTGGQHRPSPDESLLPASEELARALGEEKLRYLLKSTNGRGSLIRRINKALRRRDYHTVLVLLRYLGMKPHTRVYNHIVREILSSRNNGNAGSHKPRDVLSALRELSRKGDDNTLRYLSALRRDMPRTLEPYESSPDGSHESSNVLTTLLEKLRRRDSSIHDNPLTEITLAERNRQHPTRLHGTFDSSGKEEAIEALLDYARRETSPEKRSELTKQITKALLSSNERPLSTHATKHGQLSKIMSVHSTTRSEARPRGITESKVISSPYQTSYGAAPVPMPVSSAPTGQLPQQYQPAALIGTNSFSTAGSAQPFPQSYPQFVSQAYVPIGASGVPDQSTMLNRQFVTSTGSTYGSPQAQSATTMMSGTAGYAGYATVPTSTAYMSQYATQPYYLGTSLYGGHPHYVVEGHEAPGTRWQLRVWRHHPGVSYAAPGFSGFQSSHLGSVVARARETVTNGPPLGSQAGHFGFTTYGSSLPGGSISTASSQYIVKAPDGSSVLSRQPLTYGSLAQGGPTPRMVVSQTKATQTVTGTTVPTVSSGLSSTSIQSTVEGGSSAGTTKSESLSEMSQTKESSLFSSAGSNGESQNKESLFGRSEDSSSSVKSSSDLSQSKLRR